MSNFCGRTAPPPNQKMKLSHEALSISQLTDEVAAMLHREGKYSIDHDGYGKSIPNAPHVLSTPQPRRQNDGLRLSSPVSVVEDVSSYFDTDTRRKVCDWMYRIVDHYSLERESICVAMSCYDRYIIRSMCFSKEVCQLAAVTALLIAVKINETRRKDTLNFFTSLCAGRFTSEDILMMENDMMTVLEWYLHPPTPQAFVFHFTSLLCLQHLGKGHDPSIPTIIYENATYITEIAVLNGDTAFTKASTLGFASMMIALNAVKSTVLSPDQITEFSNFLFSLQIDDLNVINSTARNINESLRLDDCHLTLDQIRLKLDPSRIVYNDN